MATSPAFGSAGLISTVGASISLPINSPLTNHINDINHQPSLLNVSIPALHSRRHRYFDSLRLYIGLAPREDIAPNIDTTWLSSASTLAVAVRLLALHHHFLENSGLCHLRSGFRYTAIFSFAMTTCTFRIRTKVRTPIASVGKACPRPARCFAEKLDTSTTDAQSSAFAVL